MRVPNIYLGKYSKSLNKTKKVARTVTRQKTYTQKLQKQETEKEQELIAYIQKQKELDKEITEKMNDAIKNLRVSEIRYNVLLLYGISLDKEKILEILKARKAK